MRCWQYTRRCTYIGQQGMRKRRTCPLRTEKDSGHNGNAARSWAGTTGRRQTYKRLDRLLQCLLTENNTNPWQYTHHCTNTYQRGMRCRRSTRLKYSRRLRCTSTGLKGIQSRRPLKAGSMYHWSACMNWCSRTSTGLTDTCWWRLRTASRSRYMNLNLSTIDIRWGRTLTPKKHNSLPDTRLIRNCSHWDTWCNCTSDTCFLPAGTRRYTRSTCSTRSDNRWTNYTHWGIRNYCMRGMPLPAAGTARCTSESCNTRSDIRPRPRYSRSHTRWYYTKDTKTLAVDRRPHMWYSTVMRKRDTAASGTTRHTRRSLRTTPDRRYTCLILRSTEVRRSLRTHWGTLQHPMCNRSDTQYSCKKGTSILIVDMNRSMRERSEEA